MIRSKKTKRQAPGKKKGSAVKKKTKSKAKSTQSSTKKQRDQKSTNFPFLSYAKESTEAKNAGTTKKAKIEKISENTNISTNPIPLKVSPNLPAKIDEVATDPDKVYRGRPSKITKTLVDKICNIIRMGMYPDMACAAVGLSKPVIFDWFKRGAQEDPAENGLYIYFFDSISEAQAEAELRDVSIVDIAANGRPAEFDAAGNKVRDEIKPLWTAAAWKLQRRFSQRWGEKQMKNMGMDSGTAQMGQAEKEAQIKGNQLDEEAMDMIERLSDKLTVIDAESGEVIE